MLAVQSGDFADTARYAGIQRGGGQGDPSIDEGIQCEGKRWRQFRLETAPDRQAEQATAKSRHPFGQRLGVHRRMNLLGESNLRAAATVAHRSAHQAEACDHHAPSRGFRDSTRIQC